MKILSWNINGIRAAERKGIIEWTMKEEPDILCLQETKAQPEQLSKKLLNIEKYKSYFSSAERKGYSGVAVYTKEEPINIEYGLGVDRFDIEGRTIILYFEKFILYNIYYPNGGASDIRLQYKMDFYDAFIERVLKDEKHKKPVYICGDFNTAHKEIDLARPKENSNISGFLPMERAWIDKFIESGYIDTFREFNKEGENYSWWDYKTRARERNVGWRIDYFFSNAEGRKILDDAFIMPDVMGSDHCPVGIKLKSHGFPVVSGI
jgi:exodeoxyribonuclease-3